MKAAVLHRFREPLRLEDVASPSASGDAVVVQVRAAGVCRTDLHIVDGRFPDLPLPRILGHEIAVHAPGVGDALVFASWGCGSCLFCRRGDEQLCPDAHEPGWYTDGGYAEALLVPSARYLLPLRGLDPAGAAPLADAGVTPYRAVARARAWLDEGTNAVVIGAGGLGQFAIQYVKLLSRATLVVVDPDPTKRRRALQLGADVAAAPDETLPRANVVFDFVGSDDTLRAGARILERGGLLVLVGEAGGSLPVRFGNFPHEAHVTTSVWGSRSDLEAVLALARDGRLRWDVECLPLGSVNTALDRLRRGDVSGRLVVVP
jgi:propanol-preferring alcohol dehydrogenase